MSYKTQNPPPAMAYRFESGHRHQSEKGGISLPFLIGNEDEDSNPSNTSVRWTLAVTGTKIRNPFGDNVTKLVALLV